MSSSPGFGDQYISVDGNRTTLDKAKKESSPSYSVIALLGKKRRNDSTEDGSPSIPAKDCEEKISDQEASEPEQGNDLGFYGNPLVHTLETGSRSSLLHRWPVGWLGQEEAPTQSHHVHDISAARTRARVWEVSLPWCVHPRGARAQDRPTRGSRSGQ